jgi:hypothetical protein
MAALGIDPVREIDRIMASKPDVVTRETRDTGYPTTRARLMTYLNRDYVVSGQYRIGSNLFSVYVRK